MHLGAKLLGELIDSFLCGEVLSFGVLEDYMLITYSMAKGVSLRSPSSSESDRSDSFEEVADLSYAVFFSVTSKEESDFKEFDVACDSSYLITKSSRAVSFFFTKDLVEAILSF